MFDNPENFMYMSIMKTMHVNKNVYMYVYPSQSSKTRNPSFCYSSLEIPTEAFE